jgi:uncharacterized DUF497 family protein
MKAAGVEYEWDPDKDRTNLEKHGISFVEASTVFLDPLHITILDERYATGSSGFVQSAIPLRVAWS